jgi:hypothetical protein
MRHLCEQLSHYNGLVGPDGQVACRESSYSRCIVDAVLSGNREEKRRVLQPDA